MKKLAVIVVASLASITANAQLKNTKWKGTIQTDNTLNVLFDYKKDTLVVSNTDDGAHIETMTYTVKDTVLTLTKVYGQSDCNDAPAKYSFNIKSNILHVRLISDPCDDRISALNNSTWTKTK